MAAEANQVVMVARSADLRLQVLTDLLQTRWKASSQTDAGWTPWQPFPSEGFPGGSPLGGSDLAAAQLPSVDTKLGPGTGRLQVWFAWSGQDTLLTTIKSSEAPSAPWQAWEPFTPPPPVIANDRVSVAELAVVPLVDGRLQLWANLQDEPSPSLWSTVKTEQNWDSPWSQWKLFDLPGAENLLSSITAAPLPTGQTELWALGSANPGDPPLVYTAIRQAAVGDANDPVSGWAPWNLFEVPASGKDEPPTPLPTAGALLAAADGDQRTYLWADTLEDLNQNQNHWIYTYSSASGNPFAWSPLINFSTPPSQLQAGNGWVSAAPLPDGALQFFYLTQPTNPAEKGIWTRWQEPGQAPTAWTPWQNF